MKVAERSTVVRLRKLSLFADDPEVQLIEKAKQDLLELTAKEFPSCKISKMFTTVTLLHVNSRGSKLYEVKYKVNVYENS
jgi:hypothetical protein